MKQFLFYTLALSLFAFQTNAETHKPQEFLKSISGSKNEGEQIYNHFCVNCHAEKPIIPLGAPRRGNQEEWKWRLKQGMDMMFKHTDEGLNAMPARGGCFECTDKQLMMAIEFMLKKPKKNSQ